MKSATFVRFDFPFEVWTPVVSTDASGTATNLTYTKSRDGMGFLIPTTGGTANLLTKEPLSVGVQIRGLKDTSGTSVFTADGIDYPMYVVNSDPQFDTFSRIIGYKHGLRTAPTQNAQDIIDTLNGAA